jgi:hypothetical protein
MSDNQATEEHLMAYNLQEARELLEEMIDVTYLNLKNGIVETLVPSLVGDPGLGKTDLPKQIVRDRDMGYHQIDIAQIDDLTTLIGYPRKVYTLTSKVPKKDAEGNPIEGEFKVIKRDVDHDLLEAFFKAGWKPTGAPPKLSFAEPLFLKKLANPNGSILYLNDYNRGLPFVIQAVMELLQNREYSSWKLPNNCIIMCSENPDDGSNYVKMADKAQADRIIPIHVKFDPEVYASWAARNGVRSECIDFIMKHPEVVVGVDGSPGKSPRRWTKFFRQIQNLPDLRSEGSITYIQKHGNTTIGNYISNFTTFLHNAEYNLVPSEDILNLSLNTKTLIDRIQANIYYQGNFRQDISSMIAIRLKNYIGFYVDRNPVNKAVIDRMEAVLTSAKLFGADSIYNILLSIQDDERFVNLIQRPAVFKLLSSGLTS